MIGSSFLKTAAPGLMPAAPLSANLAAPARRARAMLGFTGKTTHTRAEISAVASFFTMPNRMACAAGMAPMPDCRTQGR